MSEWPKFRETRVSRRAAIRGGLLGAAGLTAAALIGCGDDDDDDAPTPTPAAATPAATAAPTAAATAAPTAAATAAPTAAAPTDEPDYVAGARAQGAPFAWNYPEPNETPKRGGIYKSVLTFAHGSFDPNTSSFAWTPNSMIGDFLVGYNVGPGLNKGLEIEVSPDYGLSTSWEPSPDGLTWTFNLREANFQNVAPVNGRALTAQDVVMAFDRMRAGFFAGPLGTMERVEAVDDRTVRISMKLPDPDLPTTLGNRQYPIYAQEPYDQGEQDTNPIGSGAMILDTANTVKDQTLAFVANADYWAGAPLLDGFQFERILDRATHLAEFVQGRVQFVRQPEELSQIRNLFDEVPGMQVTSDPFWSSGTTVYAVNPNVPPFNDVRVRRALKLAMNTVQYGNLRFPLGWNTGPAFALPFVFGPEYPAQKSIDPRTVPEEFGEWFRYDVGQARQLLEAAGVEEGFTWRHRGPAGFSGETTSQDALWQQDMQRIGLNIDFVSTESVSFTNQYYGAGFRDPETRGTESIQGWSTATPTRNGYFWENIHSDSGVNHFDTRDPEVDRLADLQRSETDPDQRQEYIRELFDYFNDQAFWMDKPPGTWTGTLLRPESRFFRFNAPHIGIHWFWDWGYGVHKAWLGETLTESPAIKLFEQ